MRRSGTAGLLRPHPLQVRATCTPQPSYSAHEGACPHLNTDSLPPASVAANGGAFGGSGAAAAALPPGSGPGVRGAAVTGPLELRCAMAERCIKARIGAAAHVPSPRRSLLPLLWMYIACFLPLCWFLPFVLAGLAVDHFNKDFKKGIGALQVGTGGLVYDKE